MAAIPLPVLVLAGEGLLINAIGFAIVLVWVLDLAITKWLRMTDTMGLFLRFAWLDANKKEELRRSLESSQRRNHPE